MRSDGGATGGTFSANHTTTVGSKTTSHSSYYDGDLKVRKRSGSKPYTTITKDENGSYRDEEGRKQSGDFIITVTSGTNAFSTTWKTSSGTDTHTPSGRVVNEYNRIYQATTSNPSQSSTQEGNYNEAGKLSSGVTGQSRSGGSIEVDFQDSYSLGGDLIEALGHLEIDRTWKTQEGRSGRRDHDTERVREILEVYQNNPSTNEVEWQEVGTLGPEFLVTVDGTVVSGSGSSVKQKSEGKVSPGSISAGASQPSISNTRAAINGFFGKLSVDSADLVADETPYLGTAKGITEAITGKKVLIDGTVEELGVLGRIGSAVGAIPGAKLAGKAAKGIGAGAVAGAKAGADAASAAFRKAKDFFDFATKKADDAANAAKNAGKTSDEILEEAAEGAGSPNTGGSNGGGSGSGGGPDGPNNNPDTGPNNTQGASGEFPDPVKPEVGGADGGIYEFPDQTNGGTPYVGQSGNIGNRLKQHEKAGRLQPGTEKTLPIPDGKTAREIAEHNRIQEITGGKKAKNSDAVSNLRDPIGPKRRPDLGLPEPLD